MRFKRITTWIVLADGARARILQNTGPGTGLTEVDELQSRAAHMPTRELGTERPGRGQESATSGRHAITPREDWHEGEKVSFAHEVAAYLKENGNAGKFDALVLAAAPRTLGELRKSIDPATAARLKSELDKDLTKIPSADLEAHLGDLVRF
jgi:protein required for attachment to host cells